MALRRTLAQRLFNVSKISYPSNTLAHSPFASPSTEQPLIPPDPAIMIFYRDFRSGSDTGKGGFFRRFLHKGTSNESAVITPELRSMSLGNKLIEKLKGMNPSRVRLQLDGLNPPATTLDSVDHISVNDARKLLRLSLLENLKTKLRTIPKDRISYAEFVRICSEGCSSDDQGLEYAKMLDESGAVIVLGNIVFLRPDQVAKAISLTMELPKDPRREELKEMEIEKIAKELEEMEKEKIAIDEKAKASVRRELQGGLGFFVIQTAVFMRLTFWELSWDVMEPICCFTTSMYCIAAYIFYLRTSSEPSYKGFYQSRFITKQRQLMKKRNFDIQRFEELRRACSSFSSKPALNYSEDLVAALHH